ncbi:inositol monophosphatase family protein [Thioclava sp. GXIMD2076]|uniref:inositol monophosphatase family protein n=1 Tax=Thioclava sp. GXIMD2076 TaxID=3131931 RepID=UPI0030CDC103
MSASHDLSSNDITALTELAGRLADAARRETLARFRPAGGIAAANKEAAGFDPVTEADRAAEAAMREILRRERPEDGIYGEEQGQSLGTSGYVWVLDPIDGTRGFMSGTPTWGVLIGLARVVDGALGAPFLGIVDQPYIGERFIGGPGIARLIGPHGEHDLKTRSAATDALADAVLFTTFPEVGTLEEGAAFKRLSTQAKLTRYGMDCYAYALLAAGQIDLVVEAQLHPYDIQGPMAVVEAAGGIVTNWQGGPAHLGGQVIAAANPEIHAAALAVLNG